MALKVSPALRSKATGLPITYRTTHRTVLSFYVVTSDALTTAATRRDPVIKVSMPLSVCMR